MPLIAPIKMPRRRIRVIIILGLLAVLLSAFGQKVQRAFLGWLLLRSPAPNQAIVQEWIDSLPHPERAIQRLWATQKLPHRIQAVEHLRTRAKSSGSLYEQTCAILAEAAVDLDQSAREIALEIIAARNDARGQELALAQLQDADPQLRWLGLHYMRHFGSPSSIPIVAPFLDDPEPIVAATAAMLLSHWTGQDLGTRVYMAIPDVHSGRPDAGLLDELANGLRRWRQWWEHHQQDYPTKPPQPARSKHLPRLPAPDFSIMDLAGRQIRLRELRGKVVLLNFWNTQTPASLSEIPDLIELQSRYARELAIIGICVGQSHSDHANEHGLTVHKHDDDHAESTLEAIEIQATIDAITQHHQINYAIALDYSGDIARRFNGLDPPAKVLIDTNGFMRRRFTGARSESALVKLVEEILKNR